MERHELGAIRDRIFANVLPSVRLVTTEALDEQLALGASKLGGAADLPADLAWPAHDGRALSFLAQLDLSALGSLLPGDALAEHRGLLSFFYDAERQPWGAPTDALTAIRVVHTPAGTALSRRSQSGVLAFSPARVEPFVEGTIPFYRTAAARALAPDGETFERYVALMCEWASEVRREPRRDGQVHRVLGHPDAIQGDMTRRLEYGLRGLDLAGDDPEAEAAARTWRLLMQVDSDSTCKMGWGDLGRLYFWIREGDLRAGRWHEVRYQLQTG